MGPWNISRGNGVWRGVGSVVVETEADDVKYNGGTEKERQALEDASIRCSTRGQTKRVQLSSRAG